MYVCLSLSYTLTLTNIFPFSLIYYSQRDSQIASSEGEIQELRMAINDGEVRYNQLQAMYDDLENSVFAKKDTATATAHAVALVLANAASTPPAPESTSSNVRTEKHLEQYELLIKQLESKNASVVSDREKYFTRNQVRVCVCAPPPLFLSLSHMLTVSLHPRLCHSY